MESLCLEFLIIVFTKNTIWIVWNNVINIGNEPTSSVAFIEKYKWEILNSNEMKRDVNISFERWLSIGLFIEIIRIIAEAK